MSKDNKPHRKIKSVRDVIIESIECEPGLEGCTGDPDTCPNEPNRCDKKLSMFGYYDDTIKNSVEHVLSESLDELTKTYTASARRWEMVVYPSMFAFILLATYGFFLIYSLTNDVSIVAKEMSGIGKNMQNIAVQIDSVAKNMVDMTQTMHSQSESMKEMNLHVRNMSVSVNQMRHEVAVMNNSVSRPMNFMNSYAPW
ncbi:MAG: hypothetical protein QM504_06005 [Pseudomonadota bacterium]